MKQLKYGKDNKFLELDAVKPKIIKAKSDKWWVVLKAGEGKVAISSTRFNDYGKFKNLKMDLQKFLLYQNDHSIYALSAIFDQVYTNNLTVLSVWNKASSEFTNFYLDPAKTKLGSYGSMLFVYTDKIRVNISLPNGNLRTIKNRLHYILSEGSGKVELDETMLEGFSITKINFFE